MKSAKIFDKTNLKGMSEEMQNEIIQRYNDYDTLIRVMTLTANNLKDLAITSKSISTTDKSDIFYLANRLKEATNTQWLKENHHWY